MTRQLRSELFKLRTTRATLLLLLWMFGLIVLVVLLHVFGLNANELRKASNQPKVYGWGTSIGALFAALLGATSFTGEIHTGMIRPTLLATPNRAVVIAAKVCAAALAGVLIGLFAEALVSGIASAGLAIRSIHISLTGGDFAQMLSGGAAAAALWAVIGTSIGAIVRNQVGAVVGLCVWLLLVESILIGDVPAAAKFSPGASAGALAGMIQNATGGDLLAPGLGALLLIAYAAAAASQASPRPNSATSTNQERSHATRRRPSIHRQKEHKRRRSGGDHGRGPDGRAAPHRRPRSRH
jgi:ABC-2 type transport system permease protein